MKCVKGASSTVVVALLGLAACQHEAPAPSAADAAAAQRDAAREKEAFELGV